MVTVGVLLAFVGASFGTGVFFPAPRWSQNITVVVASDFLQLVTCPRAVDDDFVAKHVINELPAFVESATVTAPDTDVLVYSRPLGYCGPMVSSDQLTTMLSIVPGDDSGTFDVSVYTDSSVHTNSWACSAFAIPVERLKVQCNKCATVGGIAFYVRCGSTSLSLPSGDSTAALAIAATVLAFVNLAALLGVCLFLFKRFNGKPVAR
jgi:hypothetical protein